MYLKYHTDNSTLEDNRRWLKQSMQGTGEFSAHLSYVYCLLKNDRKELKTVLRACSRQGFTPTATRNVLSRFMKCKLIEYQHVALNVYVKLNEDGESFMPGGNDE